MKRVTTGYLAALLILSLVTLAGCATQPAATPEAEAPEVVKTDQVLLALDWLMLARHAPIFTAIDKGFFADENVAVNAVRGYGSANVVKRIGAGVADFAYIDFANTMLAKGNEGTPVIGVASMFAKGPHCLTFYSDQNIQVPKDLEGKTIGGVAGDGITQLFPLLAELNDVDTDKVEFVMVDPSARYGMLIGREFDAATGYIFDKAVLQSIAPEGSTIEYLCYKDWGMDYYGNSIVTTEDMVQNNPDLVRRFVAAVLRGLEYSLEHPDEALDIVQKYNPEITDEVGQAEIEFYRDLASHPQVEEHGYGYFVPERVESMRQMLIEYLGLKSDMLAEDFYTNEFLP